MFLAESVYFILVVLFAAECVLIVALNSMHVNKV